MLLKLDTLEKTRIMRKEGLRLLFFLLKSLVVWRKVRTFAFCLQIIISTMNRKVLFLLLSLLFSPVFASAQKSELHQQAETADDRGQVATARYLFIRAFDDYANQGQMELGVKCAMRATALYYTENYFREAFDLLRRADQSIDAKTQAAQRSALHYLVTKERMRIYMRLRKNVNVAEQIAILENYANSSGSDSLKSDLLFSKATYYYSLGQNAQGDAVFNEMAQKLTSEKEYDRVDAMFQTLISNGLRSNSANMVAQAYSHYIVWKDSVSDIKHADEINALRQQIADNENTIADKDSSLSMRGAAIVGLTILAVILAAVLVIGAIILLRFIALSRKQKNTIKEVKENSMLKAKFISNISAQLTPSLQKLDGSLPEVKALLDFSSHVQTLAELECAPDEPVEKEDVQVVPFCEQLIEQIRGKVKKDVELIVKASKMTTSINKEYVSHILLHLLNNAAAHTPEGGHITLDFKKRSAHTQQFLVLDTGNGIPQEKHEDVFKPFLEVKDLSQGDGLGLPICKLMAQRMNGDLTIDSTFTKGTRFVLDLHV